LLQIHSFNKSENGSNSIVKLEGVGAAGIADSAVMICFATLYVEYLHQVEQCAMHSRDDYE
jgi:hypothetical protein